MDVSYFAYGSNLNIFQMVKRVGEWTTSKRAYLEGYRLVFNVKSPRWGGYAANIQKTGKKEDRVYGVVYFLRREKIPVMTSYEGPPPVCLDVKSEDSSVIHGVAVYMWETDKSSEIPPKAYQDTIIEGLTQHGFSQETLEEVKSKFFPTRG